MDWSDFLDLVAFNSISPITDERADINSAQQIATLGNLIRSACGANDKPYSLQDFLLFNRAKTSPDIIPENDDDEAQQIKALVTGIAKRRGIEIIKA